MKKTFIIYFVFLVLITYQYDAVACDCISPKFINDVYNSEIAIFKGSVIGVSEKHISLSFDVGGMSYAEFKVKFVVDSIYKGILKDTIVVYFYDGRDDCEIKVPDFTFGDYYLISANHCSESDSNLCNNFCSLRIKLTKPAKESFSNITAIDSTDSSKKEIEDKVKNKKRRRFLWFRKR